MKAGGIGEALTGPRYPRAVACRNARSIGRMAGRARALETPRWSPAGTWESAGRVILRDMHQPFERRGRQKSDMRRTPSSPADARMLAEAVFERGYEAAFRELYRRHTPALYQLALRVLGGAGAGAHAGDQGGRN